MHALYVQENGKGKKDAAVTVHYLCFYPVCLTASTKCCAVSCTFCCFISELWMSRQTAQIKQMTIKGLEPELERMMEKSKKDLKEAEDRFAIILKKQVKIQA